MFRRLAVTSILICFSGVGLYSQTSPFLAETFDWMANTLKPSEHNAVLVHRHTPRPYVKQWVDEEIDPYHSEAITKFSHDGCRVTFEVEIVDNDMGLLLGKVFFYNATDTFDLKDIDPKTVRIQNSCEPVETTSGPVEPWNCEDQQGKVIVFQTIDAKPTIHEQGRASSGKSRHGLWGVRHHTEYNLDKMCKLANDNGDSKNGAYCDEPETQEKPKDLTKLTLGFTTPDYAERFGKALRHAVELCGGTPSAF